MSPNVSIQFVASSPGSAEPLAAVTRSDGEVVLGERHLVGELEDALHHHRHDDERLGAVLSIASSVSSGSKRRRSTKVEPSGRPSDEVREAPGVEERRRDHDRLARARSGIFENSAASGAQGVRLGALGALRRAGRPRGEDHEAARLVGRVEVGVVGVASISSSRRGVVGRARPSLQATKRLDACRRARRASSSANSSS